MAHAISFDRKVSIIAASVQMNDVAISCTDMLRNDVMLSINEVALRANGIKL